MMKNHGILESVLKWNEEKMNRFFNNIISIIIIAVAVITGVGMAGCCCWAELEKE